MTKFSYQMYIKELPTEILNEGDVTQTCLWV